MVSVADIYRALDVSIMQRIAQELKKGTNGTFLDWELQKKRNAKNIHSSTINDLFNLSDLIISESKRTLETTAEQSIKEIDKELERSFDKKPIDPEVNMILNSYKNQMFLDLDNFVNQTLISTNYKNNVVMQMYQDIINEVTAEYNLGMKTLDKCIDEVVMKWSEKGVKSTFVDKGGHTWSLERYVETVLKSTRQRTYNDLRISRMAEYGVTTVVMSVLYDSAPRCQGCQGRVLSMLPNWLHIGEYPSIYLFGYGEPGGTLGVNCRHKIYPFIPGINENNQPRYESEQAHKNYKNEQRRKDIARSIRKTKKNIMVADELGKEVADRYKKTLRRQQARMRQHCEETGLKRNYRLEKVYTPKQILLNETILDDF